MKVAEEQQSMLRRLIEDARDAVADERRVDALWLAGSLGRKEGDALSDIDLLLIASPDSTTELAASLGEVFEIGGPVAYVHSAPQNAPLEGAHWNVLYDTRPLPVYIDWNIWPPVERRPRDVAVLFERRSFDSQDAGTFASMQNGFAKDQGLGHAIEPLNRFRVMMIPVLAKHAARGEFESVNRMLGYMKLPACAITSLEATVELTRNVLRDYGSSESEVAISTIERYLTMIEKFG